jgi:hypothetical protein
MSKKIVACSMAYVVWGDKKPKKLKNHTARYILHATNSLCYNYTIINNNNLTLNLKFYGRNKPAADG